MSRPDDAARELKDIKKGLTHPKQTPNHSAFVTAGLTGITMILKSAKDVAASSGTTPISWWDLGFFAIGIVSVAVTVVLYIVQWRISYPAWETANEVTDELLAEIEAELKAKGAKAEAKGESGA